jgi:2-polyprenyl-3-methyl-5-hydroxy-6-metoxy-1,4-benzoquinol methylase
MDEAMAVMRAEAIFRRQKTDWIMEGTLEARKRWHHLKYYTWVEQQGKTVEELNAQWYDRDYWKKIQALTPEIDKMIEQFNEEVGLIKKYK